MNEGKLDIIFSRRHDRIAEKLGVWKLESDSYVGGTRYKRGNYLHQFPLENGGRYTARVNRSVYFNHVQPIADMLSGFIYSSVPEREIPDNLAYMVERASKKKSLSSFMHGVAVHSLLYPVGVLVDSPAFDPNSIRTVADRNAAGLNPYCVMYRPERIRDFSQAADGSLEWVLLDNSEIDRSDPLSPPTSVKTYRLWTRYEYTDYTEISDKVIAGDTVAHNLGEVPFIFVNWRDINSDNIAESVFEDIALLDQAIYNFISLLDEMVTAGTFQVLFWPGDELPDQMIKSGVGAMSVIPYNPADGGRPYYDGAKLSELAPFLSAIEMYLKEIYAKVGLDKDRDQVGVQSGVAKRLEFEKAESLLRVAAEQLEQTEIRIFELAAMWQGSSETAAIKYVRQFQREDVDVLLTRLYELLTLPFESVRNTVHREILIKVLSYMDSQTLNKLLSEVEAEQQASAIGTAKPADLVAGISGEEEEEEEEEEEGD